MKKNALLSQLELKGSNGNALLEITDNYIICHVSDEPKISGYAVIQVDEGILLLPYGDVLVNDGWEQFYMDMAVLTDYPGIKHIEEYIQSQLLCFKKLSIEV